MLRSKIGSAINSQSPNDEWICSHLITYADDILCKWKIQNASQLGDIVQQIGPIFDCIEDSGLLISFAKTAILLRVEGHGAKTWLKKHTVHQNGRKWLQVPQKNGHTLIQLVPHHVYLGAKLSFTHFEQQTLKRRLRIGRTTFLTRKPWFTGKHVLTSKDRANLWSTSILSTYAHGLGSSGLRKMSFANLSGTMLGRPCLSAMIS